MLNPERPRDPRAYHNLGVAHGVAGVVGLLGRAAAQLPTLREDCRRAVRWLLAQRIRRTFPQFGMVAGQNEATPYWYRPAWCYGDLGIASVLAAAGDRCGEPEWVREGSRLGIGVATTAPVMSETSSICHGAAGNAHMFARLYQRTGDMEFRNAAESWYRLVFQQFNDRGGFGGVDRWPIHIRAGTGFLRGEAGVVLALIASVSDGDPAWDSLLLL